MRRQKRTNPPVSKLEKVLPIKGLRLAEDIHTDVKRFAANSGRTMVQQVRHYVIQSVIAEREGIHGMGEVSELLKKVAKEHEELKAQLQELIKAVARNAPADKTPPQNN